MNARTECPLCKKGHSKRYYAYYPIQSGKGTTAVIELTASSEATLVDFLKQMPEMSIPVLTVKREAGRKNNPVIVSVDYRHVSREEFVSFAGKTIDKDLIKRTLCKLWNMPDWEAGENENDYSEIAAAYLTDLVEGHCDDRD